MSVDLVIEAHAECSECRRMAEYAYCDHHHAMILENESKRGHDEGHEEGMKEGRADGLSDGYEEGYKAGLEAGKATPAV